MKNKFCGFVIDSVDYKDNDSIVTILCEDGLVSLKARGTKKVNSKMYKKFLFICDFCAILPKLLVRYWQIENVNI